MKYLKALLVFLGIIFISASFISADLKIGNKTHELQTSYRPYENISGWINISFVNELVTETFTDTFSNNFSLRELLEANPSVSYNCSAFACSESYKGTNPQTTKTANIGPLTNTSIGFILSGTNIDVQSLSFQLASSAPQSCSNQVILDLFGDGTIDFANSNLGVGSCPATKNYGCYNPSTTSEEYLIGSQTYCQLVNFSASPGFQVGAWIKKSDEATLQMQVYDSSGNEIPNGTCTLPDASVSGGEIYCTITPKVITPTSYYVCVSRDSATQGNYRILGTDQKDLCGASTIPPFTPTASYRIFAQGLSYGPVNSVTISENSESESDIPYKIESYLRENYGGENINCSSGCVVPFIIRGSSTNSLELSNLAVAYEKSAGAVTENRWYDLLPNQVYASSNGYQLFSLNTLGNIVGKDKGSKTYRMEYDGDKLFSQVISIGSGAQFFVLTPLKTVVGYPTIFSVYLNQSGTGNTYVWDLGNGDQQTSTTSALTYRYNATGNYSMTISVNLSSGQNMVKNFSVEVLSPREGISKQIARNQKALEDIATQISRIDPATQVLIKEVLAFDTLQEQHRAIQTNFTTAQTDAEYAALFDALAALKIPQEVRVENRVSGLTYYPTEDSIDLDSLAEEINTDLSNYDSAQLKESIILWNGQAIHTTMDQKDVFIVTDEVPTKLLSTFTFTIRETNPLSYTYYAIIGPLLGFSTGDGNILSKDTYYVKSISEDNEVISFTTTDDVQLRTLPFFISPDVKNLALGTPIINDSGSSNMLLLLSILFIIVLIALILYQWYAKRAIIDYEKKIFKSQNDLASLKSYIANAQKKGVKNEQIKETLGKAGWTKEQITYAFEKKSFKLFAIPSFNLNFSSSKKNQNLSAPQTKNPSGNDLNKFRPTFTRR